jgi:hypothetical protein
LGFVACAIGHGVAFTRWRKWSESEKARSWKLYGWFTALSCAGCTVGAIAYGARVGHLSYVYTVIQYQQIKNPSLWDSQMKNQIQGDRHRFAAAHFMTYPFELAFVTLANLCVLHRLHFFSVSGSLSAAWTRAAWAFRSFMVAGLLVGIGGNFAAGAGYSQSADSHSAAITAWANNRSATAKQYEKQAAATTTQANSIASVQRFSEACVLLALIAAFMFVGFNSFRIIVTALRSLRSTVSNSNDQRQSQQLKLIAQAKHQLIADASKQARKLLRKIVVTFLLGSGVVRAIFQIMYAVAMSGQDLSNTCSPSSCDPCKNVTPPSPSHFPSPPPPPRPPWHRPLQVVASHMSQVYSNIQYWILYTPTFQMITMLIASPLTLAVALWGMSGPRLFFCPANFKCCLLPNVYP